MMKMFWVVEDFSKTEYREVTTLKLYVSGLKKDSISLLLTLHFEKFDYMNHPKYYRHAGTFTTMSFDGIQNLRQIMTSQCVDLEAAKELATEKIKDYALGLLSGIEHFFIEEISVTENV